ncbi:MAG: enoyl-CoA hydratase-related protein [Pseudomonadota bacterium]
MTTTTALPSAGRVAPALIAGNRQLLAGYRATHFKWEASDGVATLTLNRPERKNPLTFDSYAELRDLFGALKYATDVHAVVLIDAGDNFCSGGDVCVRGACAIPPRIIGQGRASELLDTGRSMAGEEGERWGFFNRLVSHETLLADATAMARDIAAGPTFANGITKTMLHQEWAMTIDQAIESEAQAQAICMLTEDFARADHAFVAKQRPRFEGN